MNVAPVPAAELPTHLARVATRLNTVGPAESADSFLLATYLGEALIKTIGTIFYASLRSTVPEEAYRLGHLLTRSDSPGDWVLVAREVTAPPLVRFIPPEFFPLVEWMTKRRNKADDQWFRIAASDTVAILRALNLDEEATRRWDCVRDLLLAISTIRNKTRAHGALGPDFFSQHNAGYISVLSSLVVHCPALQWDWRHLLTRESGKPRGVALRGDSTLFLKDEETRRYAFTTAGIYFVPANSPRSYACSPFLLSNRECTEFYFANGSFSPGSGQAEFIDYGSGSTQRRDLTEFLAPPVALPPSSTAGMEKLTVQSNVFGNLPNLPSGYVERPALQAELKSKLLDRNHHIVTLFGRGGVGKTSLALFEAHRLSAQDDSPFDQILWFSSRDIDLDVAGPHSVRPSVVDLVSISRSYGRLFETPDTLENFAQVLQQPSFGTKGSLFVFDNFETMADMTELYTFLDTHTHAPNKVLITSRERKFKADWPIEVRGLEHAEARQLVDRVADELQIAGILTFENIESIIDYTEGHAYVMRVVLGEIAKEKRYVPPAQLIPRRLDIENAIFESSFAKLSETARYVFLIVSNWESAVSRLALIVVIGRRDFDVTSGLDECLRLSLLTKDDPGDAEPIYSAPRLARVFGRRKLIGDPDRLIIQEDLETLRQFGPINLKAKKAGTVEQQVLRFLGWCREEALRIPEEAPKMDSLIEAVAEIWPRAWLMLAQFREELGFEKSRVEGAYRRAVEEMPSSRDAWIARAQFAQRQHDDATRVAALISAVEADPTQVAFVSEVANELNRYVSAHKSEIPPTRRGIYLASVREYMVRISDRLDADGLSRLAWLFFNENKATEALKYALDGLEREPGNPYCQSVKSRAEETLGRPGRRS